jgi:hypothetical protein
MQTPRRRTYEVEIMGMMSQPNLANNAVQEFVSLQNRKGASHCRKLLADGHQKRGLRNAIRELCGSPSALFKCGLSRMSQRRSIVSR